MQKVAIKINGRDAPVSAFFVPGGGTHAHIQQLLAAMGLNYDVQGKGGYVEITTGQAVPQPQQTFKALAGKRIAISAGHGNGRNVSLCDRRYNESDFVLAVSLELEQQLLADGATTFLPRRGKAEDMTLDERIKRIDNFKADICLDVHTDSIGTACMTARGVHVIRQIKRPGDPLAAALYDEIPKATGLPKNARGIWDKAGAPGFDWYAMLRGPRAHNVIIENGFHSNRQDLDFYLSPGAAKKIAQGIRNGVVRFVTGKV